MPALADIFDAADLTAAIDGGYVRVQRHPTLPLEIYNYTERAQFEGAWTPVTLACRGLIVAVDGTVVARPLPKFFNYGQPGAPALDPTARVHVTDKADGCFPRGTALNLWDGGTIRIEQVVRDRLPVTLVGMDESGNMVPAVVTNWHHNGRKDHWLDIEVDVNVSRRSGAAGRPNRLRVTTNHRIAVRGEYRPACDIRPGDILTTQGWEPDDKAVRVVRASLLGDGCLVPSATRPDQAKYQEPHSEKQAEYVYALRKALGNCASNRTDTVSGYGSRLVWAGSREYRALGDLRREWYPGGVKRVPPDLSWIDDFVVAKWLMDDGHRQHFARQADRIFFSTHAFTEHDIRRLGDRLADLYGITYHVKDDGGRGLALVVNSGRQQQILRLWAAIAKHVHPSMRYKLPENFRDVPYEELSPAVELTVARQCRVLSVSAVPPTQRNFPSGRTGFDVTTTTGNYLARGVLVHNSLGLMYQGVDGWAVATRGSFASDQAVHATEVLRTRYAGFTPPDGLTVLVEIIYPGNRIVIDYGDMDDLVLLGAVDIATGRTYGPDAVPGWPGPVITRFDHGTLAEALAAAPRPNREGFVVWFPDTDVRVKIKYEEYVRLHRIVTGLSARTVWEALVAGRSVAEIVEPLPDEFHPWVAEVVASLNAEVDVMAAGVEAAFVEIVAGMPDGWVRRDFALIAAVHPERAALFLRLDGRDYRPLLWQRVRPAADQTPSGRIIDEDG